MKKQFIFLGLLSLVLLFTACAKPFVGKIKTNVAAENDIQFTPELRQLLQNIPKPKIVIRVANPSTNVTEADRFNTYMNEIEKMFVKSGYTVRDRALLENLMRSGNTDYRSIKDKIDTDLIIDILSLNFDGVNKARSFFNTKTRQRETFLTDKTYLECALITLDCRVTIVNRGQLGGMFTLRTSPCDMVVQQIVINATRELMAWPGRETRGMYPVLRYLVNAEPERRYFTQILAKQLINLLSSQ
ncbi:MAG: hypothetical protein JXO51_11580 [Candidatus Aminicenantes bacterium]|nr:hypothetical protein [Candidatus Aminicenantes bacterium]